MSILYGRFYTLFTLEEPQCLQTSAIRPYEASGWRMGRMCAGSSALRLARSPLDKPRHFPSRHRIPIMVGLGACFWTSLLHEEANTPHLNPLPYTTTASRGLGSPQGERQGKLAITKATVDESDAGKGGVSVKTCVFPKRTHRFCGRFLVYHQHFQLLMSFAELVCRWVRFGKRTHRRGYLVGLEAEKLENEATFGCFQEASDARQRVPSGAKHETWQARTAGPAVPTGGK